MNLRAALRTAELDASLLFDAEVSGVSADSRVTSPGDLFVVMLHGKSDPLPHAQAAVEKGAVAILTGDPVVGEALRGHGFPVVAFDAGGDLARFHRVVGPVAQAILGDPSQNLRIIGVTGTNGKTTCAYLLAQALNFLGERAAYLGTLGLLLPGESMQELANTTPFPVELWCHLSTLRQANVTALAMEVSSHAVHQNRFAGLEFDLGIFTNLTQDHLDYHESMEAYAAVKRSFLTNCYTKQSRPFRAVINAADPHGAEWLRDMEGEAVAVQPGTSPLRVQDVQLNRIGGKIKGIPFSTQLGGTFNVENLSLVCRALLALGYSASQIASSFEALRPVPGRFESVSGPQGPKVIVDYAHTPDALEKVLRAARELGPKNVIAVFGCGGDRDRSKRPLMAAMASEWADRVILTSDNPRSEDPEKILDDVAAGIDPRVPAFRVVDRPLAIAKAIEEATEGDVVVIAGKGSEKTQTIMDRKIAMDDVALAKSALEVWKP